MNIGQRERRRVILLIDRDAHARAILRDALDAAGFTVGEAATAAEGERTVARIRPHAVILDLLHEHDIEGVAEATRIHAIGNHPPVYIVSSAADALVGGTGLHELGVAGIFLKPMDLPIIVQTLRTRLSGPLRGTRERGHA